jgi:hypothetical protein
MSTSLPPLIEIGESNSPNGIRVYSAYAGLCAGSPQGLAVGSSFERMLTPFDLPTTAQISGSLQSFMVGAGPTKLHLQIDPYRGPREPQVQDQMNTAALKLWLVASIVRLSESAPALIVATRTKSKVVASFVGRVEAEQTDSANVSLVDEATGERLESKCDLEFLRQNGIGTGDEFRCEVIRVGGTTSTQLSRLPPKAIPKERVQEVRKQFRDRWNF